MEKVKKSFKLVAIASALVIAILNSQSVVDIVASDSALKNLNALQASAGEMWCDTSNQSTCTMHFGNVTGYSTGDMHLYP